jgi:hypothetical protein
MTSQKLKAGTRSQTYLLLTEQKIFAFLSVILIFNFWSLIFWGLPRGVYPEPREILRYAQNDI